MFSLILAMRTANLSARVARPNFLATRMSCPLASAIRSTALGGRSDKHRTDELVQCRNIARTYNRTFSSNNLAAVGALVKDSLKDLQMRDLAQVPQPIFWTAALGLVPIVAPSLSFLLFGFNNGLASLQMTYGALLASFFGGTQFGGLIKEGANWENIGLSLTPTVISLVGLVMPQILGFIIITSAVGFTTFIDLTSQQLPKAYRSMRLAFSIPVLVLLLFTCFFRLFH